MGRDRQPDGVDAVRATAEDLATYETARQHLAQMQVPLMHRTTDPNSRLFVIGFDGTGNDMAQQPRGNWTNVALLHEQITERQRDDATIKGGYVPGPGTQGSFLSRTRDLISGRSFEARIEDGYRQFIEKASDWLKKNPDADIKIFANGFSRGAEQAAAFSRLVHERGIQDPDGARYERNRAGEITGITYERPPLVAPGQVAQAALLYDPVGTGEPQKHDRRLPPSAISAFQITALNERRDQFLSSEHVEPGLSADRRSANVATAGAHSNIGGSYIRNGLSDRNFNLAADYMNALSDRPFVEKRTLSLDPSLDVIHLSEQHQRFYTTRTSDDGVRDRVQRLAPDVACRFRGPCDDREPVDSALAGRFEWRTPTITDDPQPAVPDERNPQSLSQRREASTHTPFYERGMSGEAHSPKQSVDELFNRLAISAQRGDVTGMRGASQDYVRLESGQQWLQDGREQHAAQVAERAAEVERQAIAQRETAQAASAQTEALEVSAPAMRR